MPGYPSFALALVLALSASVTLTACDPVSDASEQELIQRAKDFEDKNNVKASIIELKNALQKNPDSIEARQLLGQIYLKSSQGAAAEKELGRALQLGGSREVLLPQIGEALLLMEQPQRVIDEVAIEDTMSPHNQARILQLRGHALLQLRKINDARALFEKSRALDATIPQTYWGLALCAVATREMAQARAWLDHASKLPTEQAGTRMLIGDWEHLNDNPKAALAAYSAVLKVEPDNLKALHSHASLSMAMGQWDSASKDIEKTRKLAPKSLGTHYLQALFNYKQKKYPEARDELQEVFRIDPNHMPSILLSGETAYALASYQQAESLLYRFLAQYPGNNQARRLLAATLIKQKKSAKALETLAPLLSPDVRDATALAIASEAYRTLRQPVKAAELLEKAALIDPKNALVHTQLGITLLATGDTSRAISELESAAALSPNQHEADNLLVLSYLERKNYDKAFIAINAMEKKLPNSPVTHNLRGQAYFGKNDFVNARMSFEKALTVDPSFFPAAASLAQIDLRNKQPDAARKRLEGVLNKDKNNLQAMLALAELAALNKQGKEYISWLEKAVKAHPEAIPPRAALVSHYMARKEPKQALTLANEAVNANPDDPAALNLLGTLQLSNGDKTAAASTFTKLTKKAPQSPNAFLHLAWIQMAGNNLKDARTNVLKALQLNPGHLQGQETLLRLAVAENKPETALQIARKIQAQQPESPLGYEREGDIELAQKHLPQAAKAYELALNKGAGSAGLIKLHRALSLTGNLQMAEQRLSDWLKRHPNDNTVRTYTAESYLRNGRNREAIAQFQLVLRQAPDNTSALNNLATLYQTEKDNRALPTAEQALKQAPDSPAVQDTLGWILVEQGQAPRGLALLRKALVKAPKTASIRYHHVIALARTGNKVEARKELEQLLRDTPNFPERDIAKSLLNTL